MPIQRTVRLPWSFAHSKGKGFNRNFTRLSAIWVHTELLQRDSNGYAVTKSSLLCNIENSRVNDFC